MTACLPGQECPYLPNRVEQTDDGGRTWMPFTTPGDTSTPSPAPTPTFVPSTRPDVGAKVRTMQLVADTGFVLIDDALLRSPFIRNGERIVPGPPVDIAPPGIAITDIRGFRFIDNQRGWLVASGTPDDASQTLQLLVFRTDDGGDSWQSSSFNDGGFVYYENRSRAADIDVVDANRGWIVLDTMATMNSPAGDLFRTDDGGQTWTDASDIPTGQGVHFIDEQTGWQAAAPCSTCPINQLYVTRDGGQTWTDASDITPLAQSPGQRTFGPPVAVNGGTQLLLPVTIASQIETPPADFVLYSSTDSGQSWTQVAQTPVGSYGIGSAAAAYIFASGAVVVFSPDGTGYQLAPGATDFQSFTPAETGDVQNVFSQAGFFTPYSLDFLDRQHGWGLTGAGGCLQFKSDCWQVTFVQQTDDGGLTWTPLPFGSAPTSTQTPTP